MFEQSITSDPDEILTDEQLEDAGLLFSGLTEPHADKRDSTR